MKKRHKESSKPAGQWVTPEAMAQLMKQCFAEGEAKGRQLERDAFRTERAQATTQALSAAAQACEAVARCVVALEPRR